MAVTLTKTWTSGEILTHTDLNQNFTDVANKFSAGITTADLSASAGILNAQLANKHYEIVLNLTVNGVTFAAATAGDYLAFAGLPADVNAEDYSIVQVDALQHAMTGAGFGGTAAFDVVFGYFAGTDSAFTVSDTVKNAQATVAVTAGQGAAYTITPADSSITLSTTNKQFFALVKDTAEAGWAADTEILTVSIKLKRTSGLRS